MKKQLLQSTIGLLLLLPLSVSAEEVSSSTLSTSTKETIEDASTTPSLAKSFTLCSQEAIEKRDTQIAQSRSLYNNAMTNALTERKNKEKAAVAIKDEDDKKAAIKTSVETYKNKVKSAQNTLTQARKVTWQNFEDDIKNCRDTKNIQEEESDTASTSTKTTESEVKNLKETIKAGIETLKSLFN